MGMTFADEVVVRCNELLDASKLDLAAWFQKANGLLSDVISETSKDGKADPLKVNDAPWRSLRRCTEELMKRGDHAHTTAWIGRVFEEWWDAMTKFQVDTGASISTASRAMAGYDLARHHHHLGNRGAALRWAALAHLADRLGNHPGGGGAEVILTMGLGLSRVTIDLLNNAASTRCGKSENDWSSPYCFPEMCLAYAIDQDDGSPLVESSPSEHFICRPFLGRLLKWAFEEPRKEEGYKKGERLELVTAYLGGTLPGARCRRGFNALGFSCEHDVVVGQRPGQVYTLPGGSNALLIECKNYGKPISVEPVGYFLARLQYTGASLGLLVAKSGISNNKAQGDEANARAFLLGFCQRENIACLVVTREDLEGLLSGGSFRALLDEKYEEFMFGRKKQYA
jgi:hypothetical protein